VGACFINEFCLQKSAVDLTSWIISLLQLLFEAIPNHKPHDYSSTYSKNQAKIFYGFLSQSH